MYINKSFIGLVAVLSLASGLTYAASGSFGEVASSSPCQCTMFNATNTTGAWVLVNNFNYSLSFSVIEPRLNNVSIGLSAMNGTIAPYAVYQINISVSTNASVNESGYLTAYAENAGHGGAGGGNQTKLTVSKLIEITGSIPKASKTHVSATTSQGAATSSSPAAAVPVSSGSTRTIIAFIAVIAAVIVAIVGYRMLKRGGKS